MAKEKADKSTFNPDWCLAPGSRILEIAGNNKWDKTEVCKRLGITRVVLEKLYGGEQKITAGFAATLARVLGGPAIFWMRLERNYRKGLAAGLKDTTDYPPKRAVLKPAPVKHAEPEVVPAHLQLKKMGLWMVSILSTNGIHGMWMCTGKDPRKEPWWKELEAQVLAKDKAYVLDAVPVGVMTPDRLKHEITKALK